MSRVAIIIPTYNRADLIGETIESALAQTYKDALPELASPKTWAETFEDSLAQ